MAFYKFLKVLLNITLEESGTTWQNWMASAVHKAYSTTPRHIWTSGRGLGHLTQASSQHDPWQRGNPRQTQQLQITVQITGSAP